MMDHRQQSARFNLRLHSASLHQIVNLLRTISQLVKPDPVNTVIVIEHNLDVIKTADWIVDMGPEGGDRGGEVVVAGTPEQVVACETSHTGYYLKRLL